MNPPGSKFYSDWAGSSGFIYVIGTSSGSGSISVIPVANPASASEATGLIGMNTSQARAIDADPLGDAYVVSQQDDGTIQLDRLLVGTSTTDGAIVLAASGTYPGVGALPSNNGALVVYTVGSQVWATVHVY
jgi:hypothetical protein